MPDMNPEISAILIDWYASHRRDLPWRDTHDPYRIWLSEIILQQTRVAQGTDYYHRFVQRFPDIAALAAAREDEVLKLWQGLGYYSRARNLHAAARQVADEFGGRFPDTYEDVRSLRGVGDYTAAAICSFAYGQPHAVVDGNVYRVLARLFDTDLPIDSTQGRRYFQQLADGLLDRRRPGLSNQAIMEFGALQCTPRSPGCPECPLGDRCLALRSGSVERLPVKNGRTQARPRYFNYLHIRCGSSMLLRQRTGKDIWQHLYELPLIETEAPAGWDTLHRLPQFAALTAEMGTLTLASTCEMPRHQLSHQTIHATFYEVGAERLDRAPGDCLLIDERQLGDYAIARLTELYLEKK